MGVKVLAERVIANREFPPPKSLKAVRRFFSMAQFYARFVKDFSSIAEPLHALKRKGAKFSWGLFQQEAFDKLKLASTTVLQLPDFPKEFFLVCDSSDVAISAVFLQKLKNDFAPIAFSSRLLAPAKRRYSIYEKEALAVVNVCEKFRSCLEHNEFTLMKDNQALSWLLRHVRE
jgi:hypothetical protein